jgi:hypothetical protein
MISRALVLVPGVTGPASPPVKLHIKPVTRLLELIEHKIADAPVTMDSFPEKVLLPYETNAIRPPFARKPF